MIRRFYCKTSRQPKKQNNKQNNNNNGGINELATTDSLRTEKNASLKSKDHTMTPTIKKKGKVNESVSVSDSNDDNDKEPSPNSQEPLKSNNYGNEGNNS